MIILSNSLLDKTDEGSLKVANSIIKRIKERFSEEVKVITYDRSSKLSDIHLELNRLLISKRLRILIKKDKQRLLYFPFPAKPIATALRIFFLSRYAKYGFFTVLPMKTELGSIEKKLFEKSKTLIITFSKESYDYYKSKLSKNRIIYLKTGVDTENFNAVSFEEKIALRKKYGFDENKPILLHVGHLKAGRNVDKLLEISNKVQVVLVTSTLTENEQDTQLKNKLLEKENIKLFDFYVPNIKELYQMSDIYFFPVVQSGNCIDVPLSCMEAAACGLAVITTDYGEMCEFKGKEGFYFIDSFEKTYLNELINKVTEKDCANTRDAVLGYDWNNAVDFLLDI